MKTGDRVVVRGRTLGTVRTATADVITVAPIDADDSSYLEIPTAHASEVLRALVSADEARVAIATLAERGGSDERDVADRSIAYRRAAKSGDLAIQIRELGSIYRRAHHDYPERQYVDVLETNVYGELALVLGKQRRALKAELRGAILGEKPPAGLALPDRSAELALHAPPELAGYEAIGAFAIDTKLAVGELAAELTLAVRTGIWFAYSHGDMDDEDHHLIAMHRDVVGELDQLAREAKPRGAVTAEGATVALCDLAELDDREFITSAQGEVGVVGQRCIVWGVGSDGHFPVHVASRDRRGVYVRVEF